ncbi:BspA family leucine-rich repeat surface protein [Mycoplasma leachii]|uniref:Transmembrane protein n=1 Tax=Mycoplasma leachii 06049 TaxID=1188244 RepID=A0A2T4IAW5_9MOLU|nr:BspA family leucine-rich repeat surface protein [Mycoplasma leachii]PTD31821.1 hypothetical protein MLEAa_0340 [Mycoplasma leachii 06049]
MINKQVIKQAVYNKSYTECLEIGYFKNEQDEIQIEQFLPTTKKVPKVLPKQITSLSGAFDENLNAEIDGIQHWNTSNVTDMSHMFSEAIKFNENLSNWNTSNVRDMSGMFFEAKSFNQDLSKWNVSNVTDMSSMFYYAERFNQDLSKWNVSNVTNMSSMFYEAQNFNQPIGNWDTSNVTDMSFMFNDTENFDQDLSKWDTSNVARYGQNIGYVNPNWKPEYKPKFKKQKINWEKIIVFLTTFIISFVLLYSGARIAFSIVKAAFIS